MTGSNTNADGNKFYFGRNHDSYADVMLSGVMDGARNFIDASLIGVTRLLDIGNCGVFNYNVRAIPSITACDLFFDDKKDEKHDNIQYKQGNALNLPFNDEAFDGVLISLVLHHLTGESCRDNLYNLDRGLNEAKRVIVPGGKCVILEPTLPRLMYAVEKPMYPVTSAIIRKCSTHPPAFQYSLKALILKIREIFGGCAYTRLPMKGKTTFLHFTVPSWILPNRLYGFVAVKPKLG